MNAVKTITLSTDEFWEKMCDPRFVRVSRYKGVIGSTTYVPTIPPEDVPGYLEKRVAFIIKALGGDGR